MNWFRRMMVGRYGPDQLSFAVLIIAMAMTLLGSLFRLPVLSILSYLPLVWGVFRMFSKNTAKRYQENVFFFIRLAAYQELVWQTKNQTVTTQNPSDIPLPQMQT